MSFIVGILAVTLPIAIIILLVSALIRGVRKDKSEESFNNVIRTMYVYIVMIIFLIMIVGSIIAIFDSTLDVLLPEVVDNSYDPYASTRTMNRAIASLTSNAALFCISVPMFIYYSRLARKEHARVAKVANVAAEKTETKTEE
jgi:hypothetical protein